MEAVGSYTILQLITRVFVFFLNDHSVNMRVFSLIVARAEPMHQSGAKSCAMPLSL